MNLKNTASFIVFNRNDSLKDIWMSKKGSADSDILSPLLMLFYILGILDFITVMKARSIEKYDLILNSSTLCKWFNDPGTQLVP